jgi:hypothetical protein
MRCRAAQWLGILWRRWQARKSETRNPRSEGSPKTEDRNPNPEATPKPVGRNRQPLPVHTSRTATHTAAWPPPPSTTLDRMRVCLLPRISDFGLLSAFGSRVSDFSPSALVLWRYRPLGLLCCPLLLLVFATSFACFGQRASDPRPAPLDPVQAEKDARTLVAEMLASRPEQNTTNTGQMIIRDDADKEREIPVRFEITATPTNWISVYSTLPSASGRGGMKLTVTHSGEEPNRYELFDPSTSGDTNTVAKVLTPAQIMAPFAGSDFWIADLGLEFLHWPRQRLLERNVIKVHKACHKLESINPAPVPGGYARVESWIMIEPPHGIMHADAYDAQRKVLKHFEPKTVAKVEGEYQLKEMVMRKPNGSLTVIEFDLPQK